MNFNRLFSQLQPAFSNFSKLKPTKKIEAPTQESNNLNCLRFISHILLS